MTFSRQFPQTITTNLTTIPDIPQFRIENPLKKTIFCNGIEIVTTPEFTRKGVMVIRVNNVDLYDSRKQNGFSNVGKMAIPLDAELERDRFVEIFIFNEDDTNLISCNVTIFLDEISKSLDSSFEYISQDVVNTIVSKSQVILATQLLFNADITVLIDMEGYRKMVLLLESPPYDSGAIALIGGDNIIDGNVNSLGTGFNVSGTAGVPVVIGSVDFQTSASRRAGGILTKGLGGASATHLLQLQSSPDNSNWTTLVSVSRTEIGGYTQLLQNNVNTTFRYLRLVVTRTGGSSASTTFSTNEIFDNLNFGGTLTVDFEIKSADTGDFITYISASDIGAITQGETLRKIIGDVVQDETNNKFNFPLPSTQTDFRIRIVTTGGGLSMGISIEKIA